MLYSKYIHQQEYAKYCLKCELFAINLLVWIVYLRSDYIHTMIEKKIMPNIKKIG